MKKQVGDGQGGLACCDSWGRKESDTTERLNWTKVLWYFHLFRIFQFVVIHTVKGFDIVNKAEVDVFLEFSCFSMTQQMLTIGSLVPLPFLNPVWTSGSSQFTYCWKLGGEFWNIISSQNMDKLHTVSKNKPGSWLWFRSWTCYCQIQT